MKIASFSSAVLLAASAVSAASNIAVYEFPGKHNAEVPRVSLKSSLLYLADKFGAGEYYSIGHKDKAVEFLDLVHGKEAGKPDLLVILKGVDTPERILDDWAPTFEIETGTNKKVAPGLVKVLFKKLPKQVAGAQSALRVSHLTEELKYVSSGFAGGDDMPQQFKHFNLELPQAWAKLVRHSADEAENTQHVMGALSSGLKLVNDKLYINEIMQMVKLGSSENHTDAFAVANLDSLLSIGHRIGYNSRTYNVAKGALLQSIVALDSKFDITLVAVGPDHKIASDHLQLLKRASELDGVFSTFSKRGTSGANSCFANEAECDASTKSCSGHGSCTNVQEGCWQCLCSATQDKKTSKTTKWAGYDCSKKDIAAQAHLLLWTSVVLLATLVGGVKLLFGVGSDALPGVLQAATIDTSR
ncbi:hypothetical protein METBIDRAFT_42229 [Metschnikowia bicuspidata var. bicuspidata NRRL YB-4993]|uniref:Vacuolar sorting protein Vps3844 C-terminal domain-containing protein n=1 Tax=Metschnikowia bicuspidata var. bicuspidata NRRL YB-4993 TaxID=869754 RepID=A0A1A0HAP4_9ASCO|nr:hypothetical protein METBIDRAFT_42229 [Metschnikowia bicuspidata var. bicuspidata NRRL YB-4993]OBA20952.1 hypothetical protein METBIDRAFT_42229 [Metschnikowia bicuspidata var. bicuspidata NRRL YB-4993]